MAHAFVTGGGGFIGRKLIRRLVERGDKITCLAHRQGMEGKWQGLGVRVAYGDVRERDSFENALDGVDIVYHLAGRVLARNRNDFNEVNARGPENIAAACASKSNPPVLIVVSSLAAAGPSESGRPRTVDQACAPISNYGRSKWEGEQAAARRANDVPMSIVRPPFVFGGGDRLSLPLFKMIGRWGLHVVLRGCDLELTLIHADDLTTTLIAIAERGRRVIAEDFIAPGANGPQGIYYAGDRETINYSKLGLMIGNAFGRRVRLLRPGRPMFWSSCLVSETFAKIVRRPNALNFDKFREAQAAAWTCNVEPAHAELDAAPLAPLADRIQQTVNWYREKGWV